TVNYEFKPGERINEVEVARALLVSRTPLREALNRLSAERLLQFVPGKGFFCRDLDVHEVYNLYELRKAIEIAAVRRSVQLATDEGIDQIDRWLKEVRPAGDEFTTNELVQIDETFHESLLALSANGEMLKVLQNVNARIRFVRWIDVDQSERRVIPAEHGKIIRHLKARDEEKCVALLDKHISRRLDEITAALKEGFARIYLS
ncbi:MAG: GntR family transcriptional regulator, partial [Lautropia sp.]